MPTDGDPLGLEASLAAARLHLSQPDRAGYDVMDALLAVCLDTVPGADAAAISYAGHGSVRSTHLTDPAIAEIDAWHNRLRRGPLLDEALLGRLPRSVRMVEDLVFEVESGDLTVEVTPPFRALHSTTLRCSDGRRTALDLYALEPDVLGLDTTVLADMFVRRATQLLYGPGESAATRYGLAVNILSRRLDLGRLDAEQLLLPHLAGGTRDPVAVAERLVDRFIDDGP